MKPAAPLSHSFFAKRLLGLMLAGSALPLGVALASQFLGGLFPCELCILQRYPYLLVLVLGLVLVVFFYRANLRVLRMVAMIAGCIWLMESGLALYHVGVEQSWWESATGCTAQASAGDSLDDLRAAILSSPIVSCADPGAVVLGLSMAAWNALGALALALTGFRLRMQAPR